MDSENCRFCLFIYFMSRYERKPKHSEKTENILFLKRLAVWQFRHMNTFHRFVMYNPGQVEQSRKLLPQSSHVRYGGPRFTIVIILFILQIAIMEQHYFLRISKYCLSGLLQIKFRCSAKCIDPSSTQFFSAYTF